MSTESFIQSHRDDDVRVLALALGGLAPDERQYVLQQIEGYQLARTKLPELSTLSGWRWPVRLSMEQCSSEATARYKRGLCEQYLAEAIDDATIVDLTGGLGVDAYYMRSTDYVERNEDLCHIAEHNFALCGRTTRVHHTTSEEYLRSLAHANLIYIDPARRDSHGGKVFRLQDCTPDVTMLYPELTDRCDVLLLKLSPMLDITEALRSLPHAESVHIVALRGEVKEVLIVVRPGYTDQVKYMCVNLETDDPLFAFTQQSADIRMATQLGPYLYEPNAAIMKAGAYREVGARYGLAKLSENSHLYTGDVYVEGFPGRVWMAHEASKEELRTLTQANIICRNYPLRPEEVKRKYKLKDGGDQYLIGTRMTHPILLLAKRID